MSRLAHKPRGAWVLYLLLAELSGLAPHGLCSQPSQGQCWSVPGSICFGLFLFRHVYLECGLREVSMFCIEARIASAIKDTPPYIGRQEIRQTLAFC
ncbi:unnamed protein product [Protopolystoma xenopodis]|uniref:Secreted protein n=1 Tax=Protopolystoma xenopodis TaxID=117903 RepID=A0A448WPV7_9PLAT|nr:unnamed protein product [Protopolystoma xenopodis]